MYEFVYNVLSEALISPLKRNIMKKIIIYSLLITIAVPVFAEDGLQLFGSKRGAEKEQLDNKSSFNQDDEAKQDFS